MLRNINEIVCSWIRLQNSHNQKRTTVHNTYIFQVRTLQEVLWAHRPKARGLELIGLLPRFSRGEGWWGAGCEICTLMEAWAGGPCPATCQGLLTWELQAIQMLVISPSLKLCMSCRTRTLRYQCRLSDSEHNSSMKGPTWKDHPKSRTYNFVEVSGQSWEFSDLRFPYTMFTSQTSFNPLLLKGGRGVKAIVELTFVLLTSKNWASG